MKNLTKEQALNKLKELELYIQELDIKKPEQKFLELTSNMVMKIDPEKYPDSVFYFKDDKFMFKLEYMTKNLWVSYFNIWQILEDEFDYSFRQHKELIGIGVEKHFKWKGFTPVNISLNTSEEIENHFKFNRKF